MASDPNQGSWSTEPASPLSSDPTRTSASAIAAGQPPRAHSEISDVSPPSQARDPKRYRVVGEHGRGGLGRVSRAHDVDLGRDIAIKELISRGHVSEVRFLREALITARLEHPGIVPVYEAGRWPDGTPFYAMKLVAGRPLRELIAERTAVDERISLLHHVIAVADAIAYAHGRNIIHRDLKPANVIIGDFGETVVIDWGLAKDLTVDDESVVGGGPFREARDDGLTSAGTILGTPAYMAPEQERGEHVDQRADVFAIGAMLWELCALEKLPPSYAGQRRSLLRRSGIDPDLATIIEKALDPDPDHRYPDAGALAADLKAFKAGARIAARRYSPWAMLAHWARRRRALTMSALLVAAFAVVGITLYIRNIAEQRDRADSSEDKATRALDELTLKHAQLLLTKDPSAAIDALATYHGKDVNLAQQIRAEATGRGVAILRAMPHTSVACWAAATSSDGVLSLSTDGTIALTARDGTSTIAARGVADLCQSAYSPLTHLLAYACDPADICIYDTLHNKRVAVAPALRGAAAAALALSPDGTTLAWMSRDGVLRVVDVTDPARPSPVMSRATTGGTDVKFLDDKVVAAHVSGGIEFVDMDQGSASLSVGNSYWDASPSTRQFVTVDDRGRATLIDDGPIRVTARGDLCPGRAAGLRFIPGRREIAYACKNGTVGIWSPRDATITPRVQLEGHADLLTVSPSGDYLLAGGGDATITVLDLTTNFTTFYRGHKFRLISIAPPTSEHPFFISTDVSGAIRTWPLPHRIARVVATVDSPLHTAIFAEQDTRVIATTYHPALTTFSAPTGVATTGQHNIYNVFLENSEDGAAFAAYGFNDHIEFWSPSSMTRTSEIDTKQGTISQLHFAGDTGDVIAAGHDGRLIRWSPSGQASLLARIAEPITAFAQATATGAIVFSGRAGSLWRTGNGGEPVQLRGANSGVMRMLALPDHRTVYSGYADGNVIEIDTGSWRQTLLLHAEGAVQDISTTADGRRVAVAARDAIHVGMSSEDRPAGEMTWRQLPIRARRLAIAQDGLLVALSTDGVIWLYSIPHHHWLCVPAGTTALRHVIITSSGSDAVALDAEGRLVWIDLQAARTLMDTSR